ncbi:MAG: laccase domain-containing protein [Clostridia bacterium]|nr:laccase domain-containing protein [Clostridia bacterium]
MFTERCKNGVIYYTSPLFDRLGITHMFATRLGGVSTGAFESLNVSTARKDEQGFTDKAENVEENYRRALSVLDVAPEKAVAAKQIHTDNVTEVADNDGGRGILAHMPEMQGCDAVIARNGGNVQALCVKTADCVPILMKNIRTGAVCAVHAGWRGTASDIVTKAAKKLSDGNMDNIVAAIGPCIGRCCYEIGGEVYSRFEMLFKSKSLSYNMDMIFTVMPTCSMGGNMHLDLARANSELLEFAGVRAENIDISGICTCCFTKNGQYPFFSHRASGGFSGTFVSAISV